MTDQHGWDMRPDGMLDVNPALGWDTRVAAMIGLLRLRYARSETEFETGGVAIQVHMTPVQLRTLSEDLRRMADHIDAQHLGTRQ